jgi:hypothetical protein
MTSPAAQNLGEGFGRPCRGQASGGLYGAMARVAPVRPTTRPTTTLFRWLFQIRLSCDDARPDNSMLHTGAIRPHSGFVGSLFFMLSRTGHGSSHVFEVLPAFSCISCACAFRAGGDASIFFSGPAEAEGGTRVAAPSGWHFWNLMAHPLLGEEDSTSPPRWL